MSGKHKQQVNAKRNEVKLAWLQFFLSQAAVNRLAQKPLRKDLEKNERDETEKHSCGTSEMLLVIGFRSLALEYGSHSILFQFNSVWGLICQVSILILQSGSSSARPA